jgi:Family of unknown function (DUF695)
VGVAGQSGALIRVRTDVRDLAGHPALPNLLQISWTYLLEGQQVQVGLPTRDQAEEMTIFENRIVDALQSDPVALLVSVNTRQGERRWLWYCGAPDETERRLNAVLGRDASFPITLETLADPEWKFYRDLVSAVE